MNLVKKGTLAFCLLAAVAATAAAQDMFSSSAMGGGQAKKTLYERLGGYDAIVAVTDDFIGRLVADRRFEKFFIGQSTDSKKKIRQHVVDQLCAAAGGPCIYIGRDMKTSHTGLGISNADWDAAAKHLVESLNKFHVGQAEKDELLAFVGTLKKDIVEK